jgi:hypothetical protein
MRSEVKKRNLAITSMSAMLLATVAISMTTTDNAFGISNKVQACVKCFDDLNPDQQDQFLKEVGEQLFYKNLPMTLQEFCEQFEALALDPRGDVMMALETINEIFMDKEHMPTQAELIRCLKLLFFG